MVGPKEPHEVRPTVQKRVGFVTTRDCTIGLEGGEGDGFQGVSLPDEWDTSEGSINLISCSQCTTEKTFWQEAISSTLLLAVQKNSVNYIVDKVRAFIVDMHSL